MSRVVRTVARRADQRCHSRSCGKEGCSVSMKGVPADRVVVDLDCEALGLPDGSRSDYVFVGSDVDNTYVAPIELKSGRFSASKVVDQLQGGADAADRWLPTQCTFNFVPVLVHGKGVHRKTLNTLRNRNVRLRQHERQTLLIRCGSPLMEALRKGSAIAA